MVEHKKLYIKSVFKILGQYVRWFAIFKYTFFIYMSQFKKGDFSKPSISVIFYWVYTRMSHRTDNTGQLFNGTLIVKTVRS